MSILTACLFVFALTMSFSSCGDDSGSGTSGTSGTSTSGSAVESSGSAVESSGSAVESSGSAVESNEEEEDLGDLDMGADEEGPEAPAK
jgi:hypothetical protein